VESTEPSVHRWTDLDTARPWATLMGVRTVPAEAQPRRDVAIDLRRQPGPAEDPGLVLEWRRDGPSA